MRAYAAILKMRLWTLLQYRTAAIAGLGTQIFWGMIKVMVLGAFYASTGPETDLQKAASSPLSLEQVITFIWLAQAFLQLLPWNIDKELETLVKTGNVAYELVRPLDLYWLWFARALALRLIPTLMRSIPLCIVAGFFLGLSAPVSWTAGLAFCAALVFAAVVASAMTTLIVISLFWSVSGEGIQRLVPTVSLVLSGMLIPLPLFPEWMQTFLNIQPFRAVLDIPTRLYTGVIPATDALACFAFQIGWAVIFIGLGKWLINRAVKRFVVDGG